MNAREGTLGDLLRGFRADLEQRLSQAGFYTPPRRRAPRWTKAEDEELRRAYAAGGREACRRAFAGRRSATAIAYRCIRLGLRGMGDSLGRLEWRLQCARERVAELEAAIAAKKARDAR